MPMRRLHASTGCALGQSHGALCAPCGDEVMVHSPLAQEPGRDTEGTAACTRWCPATESHDRRQPSSERYALSCQVGPERYPAIMARRILTTMGSGDSAETDTERKSVMY